MRLRISSSEPLNHLSFSTHHVRPTARTIRRCIPPVCVQFHSVFYELMFAPARSGGTPDSLTGRTPLGPSPVAVEPRELGRRGEPRSQASGDLVAAEVRRRIDPDAESRLADTLSDIERDVNPMVLPRRAQRVLARLRRRSSW
jgi:hypothetical protein